MADALFPTISAPLRCWKSIAAEKKDSTERDSLLIRAHLQKKFTESVSKQQKQIPLSDTDADISLLCLAIDIQDAGLVQSQHRHSKKQQKKISLVRKWKRIREPSFIDTYALCFGTSFRLCYHRFPAFAAREGTKSWASSFGCRRREQIRPFKNAEREQQRLNHILPESTPSENTVWSWFRQKYSRESFVVESVEGRLKN